MILMKNYISKLKLYTIIILSVAVMFGCDDEFEGEIVKDNPAEIPVTFEGATTHGFNPYYTVSFANGNISITLQIPENSPLKIKEIRNIAAGATSINVATLTAPATIQYLDAPVTVDGYSYTFNTSITEFNTKVAAAAAITAAPAAGAPIVERAFMFRLVMEDDSFLVPMQCRIRITP
jgi:hypothetical protein